MPDRTPDDAPERWRVPQRPFFIAGALLPLALLAAVIIAGRAYDAHLRPAHRAPVTTFPAPGVETFIHDGRADPIRSTRPTATDPAIAAAKRRVVVDGVPGWSGQ